MAFLEKLQFWKKKTPDTGNNPGGDFTGFNQDLGTFDPTGTNAGLTASSFDIPPIGAPAAGQQQFPQQYQQQQRPDFFANPSQQQFQQSFQPNVNVSDKNMEIVSAKLDAIRAMLESINQRIANLERIAYGEQDKNQKRYW